MFFYLYNIGQRRRTTRIRAMPRTVPVSRSALSDNFVPPQPINIESKSDEIASPSVMTLVSSIDQEIVFGNEYVIDPKATFKKCLTETRMIDDRQIEYRKAPIKSTTGEVKCFEICEEVFGSNAGIPLFNYRDRRFANVDTGCNMELDIFYPKHSFAIEYNGVQHYINSSHFKSEARFQIARDHNKSTIARKLGIVLVSIPYNYGDAQIRSAISNGAKAAGITLKH